VSFEQMMREALAHHQAGRWAEAVAAYRRALALRPDYAEVYSNLGLALQNLGRFEEAIGAFERAAGLRPDLAAIQANMGNALRAGARFHGAIAAYRRAIELAPGFAEAHNNLGIALHESGQAEEAIAAFERAIALKSDYAEASSNLGGALSSVGRLDEAIAACQRALALRPDHALAHNNLANALLQGGRLDEAIAACQRALALRPDYAEAHCNLGNACKEQGRLDEALVHFRQAARLKQGWPEAESNYLVTLHYHPDHDARAILAEHRAWAARNADPLAGAIPRHDHDRSPARRLRVGYVSPDFRGHPVGHLLLPLFAHHDRQRFEIVCYSDVRRADPITERLRSLTSAWHDTAGMSDSQLAERVRADRIDLLVDLTLHTARNRLLVFARKPAPVQVTMLGMPATTGLATMDYRLTDPYLNPPGSSDADYTERSIRLPHCFWIYEAPEEETPVGPLPALTNGFITFGCLNPLFKVTPPALELWLRILGAVPGSRLVLLSESGAHREALRERFREGGVAGDRLEFVGRTPRAEHLRRYQRLDLGLDPFPYNGHTTTLDALWMGVPLVTLTGRTAVARGGTSILMNVGLPELIAATPEQYIKIAVALARDVPRLAELRSTLRPRMESSPLMDGKQYAADVERAFRSMWDTWCRQ
jgi:predicted O-linked N-acetylglucosamine transferase (SPINDLY family)